jgi:hypothetical protein
VSDVWMLRGPSFVNCNCAYGCPCQFGSPSTHGNCRAIAANQIVEGHYRGASLGGLNFLMLVEWPGEIAEGNGRCQFIIDERADAAQREALGKIGRGEDTTPGATHFYVFNSTMSEVLDPIYAPIECEIGVERRHARVRVPDLVESSGDPIVDSFSGNEFRAGIGLPNGFEYTYAEMGNGSTRTRTRAGVQLDLSNSYGQFYELHMNQDGPIR